MASAEDLVLLERDGGHARLVLNRPDAHNCISPELNAALLGHLRRLEGDPSLRVVTLSGRGPSFCAGADLKHFLSILDDAQAMTVFIREVKTTINAIEAFPRPVIAVLHGYVLAGGLELMMACDLALAAEDTRLGDQHANFGVFPGGGSTQRLPMLVGQRKAKELIYMGGHVSGQEAERLGLVNKAVPKDELEATTAQWVANLMEKSANGLSAMKEVIGSARNVPLPNGIDLEELAFLNYARLGDMKEGLTAFKAKRKPVFAAPLAAARRAEG